MKTQIIGVASIGIMSVQLGCGLSASTRTVDFGKVLVGTSATPQNVTWTNNTANATYSIVAWQTPSSPFSFPANPGGGDIGPGASTNAQSVGFAPTTKGNFSDNARPATIPDASDRVRIRGRGVYQILEGRRLETDTSDDSPVDFGDKLINSPPPKQATFDLNNNTNQPIVLTGTMLAGAPVFDMASANITVPARDNTTNPPTLGRVSVTMTFAPTAAGEQFGAVMYSNAGYKAGFTLRGNGVAPTATDDEDDGGSGGENDESDDGQ